MQKKHTHIKNIDYKDIETLRKFLNPNARILSHKKTGLSAGQQREVAQAVKRARYIGLLPYVAR
jgi:small subunit ribosomal protein S18